MQGVTETVPEVFVRPVARGEFLSRSDVDTRRRVAVLGSSAADQLFPGQDAVGRQLTVAGVRFRVVGVTAKTGSGALAGADPDLTVYIPITAAQRLLGTNRVDGIAVKAPDRDTIGQLGDRIVAELEKRYPGETFSAVTQEQILGVVGRILGLLTLVLAAIAGISLLVGGVGITNIMLVSVRERTREIGLRKAVGARQRDVLVQFLLEAVLLTTLGGADRDRHRGRRGASLVGQFTPLPTAVAWWSIAAGLRRLGGGRRVLRRGAGPAGRPAGSGGRAAQRMTAVRSSHPSLQYRYSSLSTCVSVVAGGEAGAATRAEVW